MSEGLTRVTPVSGHVLPRTNSMQTKTDRISVFCLNDAKKQHTDGAIDLLRVPGAPDIHSCYNYGKLVNFYTHYQSLQQLTQKTRTKNV